MRRIVAMLWFGLGVAMVVAAPVSAGNPTEDPNTTDVTDSSNQCNHVLKGAGAGPLAKAFVSQTHNLNGPGYGDDTLTLRWRLSSPRADDTDRVADCLWLDADGDRVHDAGETLYILNSSGGASGTEMTFVNGTVDVVTIIPHPGDAVVCNRASRSGADETGGFTDKSQYGTTPAPCNIDDPGAQIPEVPWAVLLPLSAAVAFGLAHAAGSRVRGIRPAT